MNKIPIQSKNLQELCGDPYMDSIEALRANGLLEIDGTATEERNAIMSSWVNSEISTKEMLNAIHASEEYQCNVFFDYSKSTKMIESLSEEMIKSLDEENT